MKQYLFVNEIITNWPTVSTLLRDSNPVFDILTLV